MINFNIQTNIEVPGGRKSIVLFGKKASHYAKQKESV